MIKDVTKHKFYACAVLNTLSWGKERPLYILHCVVEIYLHNTRENVSVRDYEYSQQSKFIFSWRFKIQQSLSWRINVHKGQATLEDTNKSL